MIVDQRDAFLTDFGEINFPSFLRQCFRIHWSPWRVLLMRLARLDSRLLVTSLLVPALMAAIGSRLLLWRALLAAGFFVAAGGSVLSSLALAAAAFPFALA